MLDLCSDEELEVGCLVLACMREASQITCDWASGWR